MVPRSKYTYADYSIGLTVLIAALICCFYTWSNPASVDLTGGDARYYYHYLHSTFIDASQANYFWLKESVVSPLAHHIPVGVSVLFAPFFMIALGAAHLFHYPLTGTSLPFQIAFSVAALTYCAIGLLFLKKLFQLQGITDKVTAFVLPLIFFGTNLIHYTVTESGVSHVYSFCLITVFLYQSNKFVYEGRTKNLIYMSTLLGLILLVRPNNGLLVFSLLFWFRSRAEFVAFFKKLFYNKYFYLSLGLLVMIVLVQPLTWYLKENTLFTNRYTPYGFYWTKPAFLEMLFGFNNGFFVYTPLCFLFLLGLVFVYKESRFLFFGMTLFLLTLFYFFSAYSEYNYYDGLGIRVLVDYYSLFALLGAKLFGRLEALRLVGSLVTALALLLMTVNLIYCYQESAGILNRTGMNYRKWKYVFLKTGNQYRDCLGGSNDLLPFAMHHPAAALSRTAILSEPFDFSKKDFGLGISFDSLGFVSNRICLKIEIDRKEDFENSSREALVCTVLESKARKGKYYHQFRLNETPSETCCPVEKYQYTLNLETDFKTHDRLSVYLWNRKLQPFCVSKFSAQVFNYSYQTN